MNKLFKYGFASLAMVTMMTACGDFEPTGYEEVPNLPTVTGLKADISGHTINVTWQLPAAGNITGVQFIQDGNTANPIALPATATSYAVVGQPLEVEGLYTVKVCYDDKYVSQGVSTTATLPAESLAGVSDLKKEVSGRSVTLSWALPAASGITAVRVYRDADVNSAIYLDADATSYVMKSQPMEEELTYTVEVMYDTYYPSVAASVTATIPYITPKMGFLLLADSWRDLPDDDERAAAQWFAEQENAEFYTAAQLADLDADLVPVVWVMVDRVGLPLGWENLPAEVSSESSIAALKAYTANGGNLFLSNMATQLTVPLGIVPGDMAPTVYGNGDGGSGDDVWVAMTYLGWIFRPDGPNAGEQGFYDRTGHAIYKGLDFTDANGWGFDGLPLIGPGQREDHNCMWDCNIYGRGSYPDVIANFEATTGSLVLATWGHVQDHCVAGIVDFFPTAQHGRCIAVGLAAYEWNQNSGTNVYQHNVEQLTTNILEYLK